MPSTEENPRKTNLVAARERGPGPARYKLPALLGFRQHDVTKMVLPAHTIGKKLCSMFKEECSPGPAYSVNCRLTRHGMDGTPIYSMLGRNKDSSFFSTPAPSRYQTEKIHPQGERHAPKYSFGSRTKYAKRDANPAASSYSLPHMLGYGMPTKFSYPAYTMTGRDHNASAYHNPGPGRYNAVPLSTFIRKGPAYSMLGRNYYKGSCSNDGVPGPGAHSPEKVYINKPKPPHFSMGIRHSEFLTPLIVEIQD